MARLRCRGWSVSYFENTAVSNFLIRVACSSVLMSEAMGLVGVGYAKEVPLTRQWGSAASAKWDVIFRRRICKEMGEPRRGVER